MIHFADGGKSCELSVTGGIFLLEKSLLMDKVFGKALQKTKAKRNTD